MLPIQPRRRRQRNKELARIRVRAGIGHGEDARACVFEVGVNLVDELAAVRGKAAAAGSGRVTALDHEIRDYTVELCERISG